MFNADVTAKAIDYTLNRWVALCAHLSHAGIGVDNNPAENAIRPLALGRKNWLFVGSQQAGERVAVLTSLIESAKLNGHDAWAYLPTAAWLSCCRIAGSRLGKAEGYL